MDYEAMKMEIKEPTEESELQRILRKFKISIPPNGHVERSPGRAVYHSGVGPYGPEITPIEKESLYDLLPKYKHLLINGSE